MSVFRFKKFEVRNEKSAMKVNTDGVLLGIAAPVNNSDSDILDIGTGTGTIALILAQRLHDTCGITDNVSITGIDIDAPAAEEAGINFSNSPWADSLTAKNISLEDFSTETGDRKFDLIVSNPPYYDASLTNPDARKTTARHTGTTGESTCGLSFREVLTFASGHLKEGGRVSIVLPADQEAALARYGRMCGLHICNILRIKTVERKQPSRIIVSFTREKSVPQEQTLTIMEKGKYTSQYISIVKEFYLFA